MLETVPLPLALGWEGFDLAGSGVQLCRTEEIINGSDSYKKPTNGLKCQDPFVKAYT